MISVINITDIIVRFINWCLINTCGFRLNSEESIQMVTALALQLIQSVVTLPQPKSDNPNEEVSEEEVSVSKKNKSNQKAKHGQVNVGEFKI